MKTNFGQREITIVCIVLAGTLFTTFGFRLVRATAQQVRSNIWRVAPPPPTISERDRLAELASRRADILKRIGDKGMMVLFAAEPRVYTNDTDYPYRQENNLFYLTGIKQDGVTLVLIPGGKKTREILFIPKADPSKETWTGHMLTLDEARNQSGIQTVWYASALNPLLTFLVPRAASVIAQQLKSEGRETDHRDEWREEFKSLTDAIRQGNGELYLLLPGEADSREYRQEQAFASQMASVAAGLSIKNAMPMFGALRLHKSEWELQLMQYAVDVTDEAFRRAFALAAPRVHEYEVQAEFDYTFRRRHADNWAYPSIVGGGVNATTLHYDTNQDALPANGLLLMDCAAEFNHYTADITRTIPLSGKFTKEQADIYRIVYDAQIAAINAVRTGNRVGRRIENKIDPKSVHGRAVEVLKDGLLRLGLITSKDTEEYRTWFMHGTSHWLGMNVHDDGDYDSPLAPGMVLTVEPGIYIRPDALDVLPKTPENDKFIAAVRPAFEKYKGIGIRIEDDVLVTSGEAKILSSALPSKLEDVERVIAELKREYGVAGFSPRSGAQ